LELLPEQVKETLQCILHTILFMRAFGPVKPREVTMDFLEVHYVCCDDQKIEKQIEERVNLFFDSWQKKKFDPTRRMATISFDEKVYKTQLFGFSKTEERICWEQWNIELVLQSNIVSKEEQKKGLEKSVQDILKHIVQLVNKYKNHIPPLVNKDLTPFPYEINFPSGEVAQGLLSTIGNMLKSGQSATPLLG